MEEKPELAPRGTRAVAWLVGISFSIAALLLLWISAFPPSGGLGAGIAVFYVLVTSAVSWCIALVGALVDAYRRRSPWMPTYVVAGGLVVILLSWALI